MINLKYVIFSFGIFCFLLSNYSFEEVSAIGLTPFNTTAISLPFSTITNGVVVDNDNDGYADRMFSSVVSSGNYTFTNFNDSTSYFLYNPSGYTLANINLSKDSILLTSYRNVGSTCFWNVAQFNTTDNTITPSAYTSSITLAGAINQNIGNSFYGANGDLILNAECGLAGALDIYVSRSASTVYINATGGEIGSSFVGHDYFTSGHPTSTVKTFTSDYLQLNSTGILFTTALGHCNTTNGCMTVDSNNNSSSKFLPSSIVASTVLVDPSVKLFVYGLEVPRSVSGGLGTTEIYMKDYFAVPEDNYFDTASLLHLSILDSSIGANDVFRFVYNDGVNQYLGYTSGANVKYTFLNPNDWNNRAIGYYQIDTVPPLHNTLFSNGTLTGYSLNIVSNLSTVTLSSKGLVSIISGYEVFPFAGIDRSLNPEVNNSIIVYPYLVGLSTGLSELTVVIKNSPSESGVMIKDNLVFGTKNYIWHQDNLLADNGFTVDLPTATCVNIFVRDLTLFNEWSDLGEVCASGSMPKTVIYSENLSFTFWSLPYGVSHTFAQETELLQTTVRHDTFPFNYTVKIFDSNDVLAYTQEFNSTNEIDIQSINASGISRPALIRVFDIDNNQLYYATIGTPSYFSDSVAWFEEWLSIEGFNLLFMLPIVFSAMFTRNTVGIGTTITVVFIATLTWVGILPIPDNVIYFMIAIGIVGMIAHKKLYD